MDAANLGNELTEVLLTREQLQKRIDEIGAEITRDYADIADTLEVPIGTVRSRIARGRAALLVLPFVDAGDIHAELRRADRGDIAARSRADDDDVESF